MSAPESHGQRAAHPQAVAPGGESWTITAPASYRAKVNLFLVPLILNLVMGLFAVPFAVVLLIVDGEFPVTGFPLVLGCVLLLFTAYVVDSAVRWLRTWQAARQARTEISGRGLLIHLLGDPVLVAWPDSRSGLFIQVVSVPHGLVRVQGCVITPQGGCRNLAGVVDIGPPWGRAAMMSGVNAQLDAIWNWGVQHGTAAESGRYRPLRHPAREQARRIDHAGGPAVPPPGGGPLDLPSVPVVAGGPPGSLVLESMDRLTHGWFLMNQRFARGLWLGAIALVVGIAMVVWDYVGREETPAAVTWTLAGIALVALAAVIVAGLVLVKAWLRRGRLTVATVPGIEVATLTGSQVVPWPQSRSGLVARVRNDLLGGIQTVEGWLVTPQGASHRLAGIMRRGPAALVEISRQEVDVELDVLWEWAVRHGAVQPVPHQPPVQ